MAAAGAEAANAGDDAQKETWTCSKCSNVNYATRQVCNTRKCSAPRYMADAKLADSPKGSWLCPGCGNVNFQSRTSCNTRKCGLPHPGNPGFGPPMVSQWGPAAWGGPAWGPPPDMWGPAAWGPAASWGPMSSAMAGPYGQKGGGKFNLVSPAEIVARAAMGKGAGKGGRNPPGAGSSAGAPPGSWQCPGCNNVNFPTREVCNTKTCGLARPFDAAPPAAEWTAPPPQRISAAAPDGSWQCPACSNLNYPSREVCNTRTCGAARPLDIAAHTPAPTSSFDAAATKDNWACGACGNVNFGHRTECNTRTCKAPRPW